MAGHPIPEKNRSAVDLHGAATKPFDARIFEIHSPDCDSEKLDRNSELRRFDTDTNEIGGSKAHSDHAGGSARTRARSDRNVMQRQAPGYYRYRVGEIV